MGFASPEILVSIFSQYTTLSIYTISINNPQQYNKYGTNSGNTICHYSITPLNISLCPDTREIKTIFGAKS